MTVEPWLNLGRIAKPNEQANPMTPEQFMQTVKPDPARRAPSKLEPHREAIEKLRAAQYTLRQICEYLEQCGVSVSFQMVSKFLRGPDTSASRTKAKTAEPVRPSSRSATPAPIGAASESSASKTRQQIAAENPELTKKQIEEKHVDQFRSVIQNPLLRRMQSK